MLKLTKKADYGLMAMKHLAEHADQGACSAKDVAEAYGIPQEALAKILQRLAKVGLIQSQHGINGGYTLTRDPKMISAFEVIKAIEKAFGAPINKVLGPRRAGDPAAIVAGADLVREVLGWKPKYDDLDLIVNSALAWERHLQKRNAA